MIKRSHTAIVFSLLAVRLACGAIGPYEVSLAGSVTEPSAAAVEVPLPLYVNLTPGRPEALAAELRVRDGSGANVPYALRPAFRQVASLEPAPAAEVNLRAEIERDKKAKKTTLIFATWGMPVTAVGVATADKNFSRPVRVLAGRNNGWTPIATGEIRSLALPGKTESRLEIPLRGEVREAALKLELDDGDNPPLALAELPVALKVARYDAIFVANPREKYTLVTEPGAERPRYDTVVLDYVASVRDPVRMTVADRNDFGDADAAPTAVWLTWNPIPCVSLVVFVLLAGVCFWLFRSTSRR